MTDGQKMLARNVWRWREIRRISASELAKRVDWSVVEIEQVERAEKFDLSLEDIDSLAIALQIAPVDLFRNDVH
ncbi:helix-turn-helix domain-containing protein [Pelagibacterium sp. 26DY04]|uniref:helix-turn-helix domain-containing protein n=1 Tax=Pelagibacterium sp. 26DY04 TaxID=2967130 RepID=UPI00281691BE|nr:helix-turn-helix transcriptional regulator [Pelagibacterium sp. 26DY04]WMT86218.1 helix-turn-helix domain-containing protein [Pelagibacterium sp. 26DY04]